LSHPDDRDSFALFWIEASLLTRYERIDPYQE